MLLFVVTVPLIFGTCWTYYQLYWDPKFTSWYKQYDNCRHNAPFLWSHGMNRQYQPHPPYSILRRQQVGNPLILFSFCWHPGEIRPVGMISVRAAKRDNKRQSHQLCGVYEKNVGPKVSSQGSAWSSIYGSLKAKFIVVVAVMMERET